MKNNPSVCVSQAERNSFQSFAVKWGNALEKGAVSGNVFPERDPEPVRKAMPAPRRISAILASSWD
jgi:hypothetical protein